MRCAAIHRKLGTHVSKVKSLSMDSWSNEQVEVRPPPASCPLSPAYPEVVSFLTFLPRQNMRKVGNSVSNKLYNAKGKKPAIPVDADEADSAMERFIRSKYTNTGVPSARRHHTGSTESDETPPPLPPKTPSRFGFRSASSIFPLSSKGRREAAARPPPSPHDLSHHGPASPRRNKASKAFGATLDRDDTADDRERKLATLRDMGFADDQRNAMVLKGVHGSLEMAIESLVRLGEGGAGRSPVSPASPRSSSLAATRSLTPAATTLGLGVPPHHRATTPSRSTNPFDMLDMPPAAQPISSQSTGTLPTNNPFLYHHGTNPFGAPAPQANAAFAQAFQNLSLAAPSQPLFPHHTGGIPAPPPMHHQQQHQPFYQTSMTQPMPASAQNFAAAAFNGHPAYPPAAPPAQHYNPFLSVQAPPRAAAPPQAPPLSVDTSASGSFGSNPFTRSPTRIQSPVLSQIPEQAQQNNFYAQAAPARTWSPAALQPGPFDAPRPQQQQQQQLPSQITNPFFHQNAGLSQQNGVGQNGVGQLQQQPFTTQQPFATQQTFAPQQAFASQQGFTSQQAFTPQRTDTASIMALYNMPQQAPPAMQARPSAGQDAATALFGPTAQPVQSSLISIPEQSRSISAPLAGNKNPFLHGGMASPAASGGQPTALNGHRSRDSMMALGMEWSNGRHSPDAFASLSARH